MATGFNGLDDAAPNDNAYIGDGAAEIRAVKNALITTFPAVDGEITKPTGYGPVTGSTQPTADDYSQLFTDMGALVSPDTTNSPVIPQGTVTMWNGNTGDAAAIADLNAKGWYLCTGGVAPNGYTIPNLQNRFVKGWGDNPVGTATGGGGVGTLRTSSPYVNGTSTPKSASSNYTLTEANIPEHKHALLRPIAEGASNSIKPADYIVDSPNQTIVGAAQGGSYDGEYRLAYDPSGPSTEPTAGQSSKYGNPTPTPIQLGLDEAGFDHEHEVVVSGDLEPAHYVIAFIIYAGVV